MVNVGCLQIVEETVPFDKMFEYAPYFTQYPQIAYKCHLANIRPSGDTGNWSISSIEALQVKEFLFFKSLFYLTQ